MILKVVRSFVMIAGVAGALLVGCGGARQTAGTEAAIRSPHVTHIQGGAVAWSPDGSQIAYAGGGNSLETALFVADLNSGTHRKLFAYPMITALAWSPNGEQIALAGAKSDLGGELFFVDAQSGAEQFLGATEFLPSLDWSPDGSRVAYTGDEGVMIARASAPKPQRLRLPGLETFGASVDWAPEGKRLAIDASNLAGEEEHVFVVGVDGKAVMDLGRGHSPSWAPDGDRVAFLDEGGLHERGGLYVRSLRRPAEHKLATFYARVGLPKPAWSPAGDRIAFVRVDRTLPFEKRSVVLIGSPGTRLRRVHGGDVAAWSPDGEMIAVVTSAPARGCGAQLIVLAGDGGGKPTTITRCPSKR